jgi:predicted nucleic acid-binding protein
MAKIPKIEPAKRFVLDCSIVCAWYFVDESEPYADAVAAALAQSTAMVPSLFHLEVANVLVGGERKARSTAAQASGFLARLSLLPIVVDEQTIGRAWSDTISVTRDKAFPPLMPLIWSLRSGNHCLWQRSTKG